MKNEKVKKKKKKKITASLRYGMKESVIMIQSFQDIGDFQSLGGYIHANKIPRLGVYR